MHKKNPLLFFMSFIIIILLGTIFSAKIYKSENQNESLFNSINSMNNYSHHGSLSILTMGDAAIIEHSDYNITYQYDDNISNLIVPPGEDFKDSPWLNVKSIYNILENAPPSFYEAIDKNYLYIKGKIEKDLTFDYSAINPTVSFTIKEGYESLVSILDMLGKDESFKDSLFTAINNSNENNSDGVANPLFTTTVKNLNDNFNFYCGKIFDAYYDQITNKFSSDSTITLEFKVNDNLLKALLIKGNLKYNNFQASETIEWLINFDIQ